MVWLCGKYLQSYIRHLLWDHQCPVPTWNLRHQCASRYKRQASCRKGYRRLFPLGLFLVGSTARSEAQAQGLPLPWSLGVLVSLLRPRLLGGSVAVKLTHAIVSACNQRSNPLLGLPT